MSVCISDINFGDRPEVSGGIIVKKKGKKEEITVYMLWSNRILQSCRSYHIPNQSRYASLISSS